MKDNRVRVATQKDINLSQLDQELGDHGLSGSATEVVAIEGSPVTEQELAQAIQNHVAIDENKIAREAAIAHARSLGFTDAMIAVMYPNLGA